MHPALKFSNCFHMCLPLLLYLSASLLDFNLCLCLLFNLLSLECLCACTYIYIHICIYAYTYTVCIYVQCMHICALCGLRGSQTECKINSKGISFFLNENLTCCHEDGSLPFSHSCM